MDPEEFLENNYHQILQKLKNWMKCHEGEEPIIMFKSRLTTRLTGFHNHELKSWRAPEKKLREEMIPTPVNVVTERSDEPHNKIVTINQAPSNPNAQIIHPILLSDPLENTSKAVCQDKTLIEVVKPDVIEPIYGDQNKTVSTTKCSIEHLKLFDQSKINFSLLKNEENILLNIKNLELKAEIKELTRSASDLKFDVEERDKEISRLNQIIIVLNSDLDKANKTCLFDKSDQELNNTELKDLRVKIKKFKMDNLKLIGIVRKKNEMIKSMNLNIVIDEGEHLPFLRTFCNDDHQDDGLCSVGVG